MLIRDVLQVALLEILRDSDALGQEWEPGMCMLIKYLLADSYQRNLGKSAAEISSNSKMPSFEPSG